MYKFVLLIIKIATIKKTCHIEPKFIEYISLIKSWNKLNENEYILLIKILSYTFKPHIS